MKHAASLLILVLAALVSVSVSAHDAHMMTKEQLLPSSATPM